MSKKRCSWVTDDPLYVVYHDEEWGVPAYNDQYLFEMLSLEGAQAGLSWLTILKRRENYRKAFDGFDPAVISQYGEEKVQELLSNAGIIRNQLKIRSVITNAQIFLDVQREFGSFSSYIWQFVDGEPIVNSWATKSDVPSQTKQSNEMSRDLKRHGFKFIGPTICYAFMQATGMVNDHEEKCFLYDKSKMRK